MKKKLNLNDLNVKSFTTSSKNIKGGLEVIIYSDAYCTNGCTQGCTAELCLEETEGPCTGYYCNIE